jgi:hypothetical protein
MDNSSFGDSVDVKQLDVPSELGFMMKSIPMHNNELFMETLCLKNYQIKKKFQSSSRRKCVPEDG